MGNINARICNNYTIGGRMKSTREKVIFCIFMVTLIIYNIYNSIKINNLEFELKKAKNNLRYIHYNIRQMNYIDAMVCEITVQTRKRMNRLEKSVK